MLGKGIGAGNWSGLRAPIIQPPVDIVAARGYGQYPVVPLTRASVATYLDADGLIKTAAVDEPRFDWTGGERALLLEAAATNLARHSGAMSSLWGTSTNTIATTDVGTAPDGGDMKNIENAGGGGNISTIQTISGLVIGQQYVVSAIARRDQHRFAKFSGFGNGSTGICFDLVSMSHSINGAWDGGGIVAIGDDYALVWGVVTPVSLNVAYLGLASNISGAEAWAGGENLSFWGVQVENAQSSISTPSSRVITEASSVTRTADAPSVNLAAGTYDVEIVTDAGTTNLSGVVHAGGAYWPAEATGRVRRVTATAA